jgi:hypothetical protein
MTAIDVHADPFIKKQNSDRLSAYFRGRRFKLMEDMIRDIHAKTGQCRIIDVGGRAEYWSPALDTLRDCKAHVTIVNLESTQPQPLPLFNFQYGDACDLKRWQDGEFDLAHSNSLIEHVGNWRNMRRCADEIRRVGKSYYVQTPYFGFPLEPHFRTPFFHWMPEQVRARLVMRFKLGYFNRAATLHQAMENVQSATLLDRRQFSALFPDAAVTFERVAGLPKSLIGRKAS